MGGNDNQELEIFGHFGAAKAHPRLACLAGV